MSTDTKKIAKNTMFMYLRLIVTIPLAFFTSRIVLQQLGVADYGIYNVVGGVISFFSILRSSFASATQRFYNVAMATKDSIELSRLFTTSLVIHIIIAVGLAAVIEVFGTWFIGHKMNYPAGRESDVFFCLHTAVLGMIFTIVNIPFDAMVIAKERMAFYSHITILDVLLKLALVSILIFVSYEKLRLYAIFQMIVPIVVFTLTLIYYKKQFRDVAVSRFDGKILKKMSFFAGWGLFGNVGEALCNQGTNLLLNVFGGVVVNAAQGIAIQVRSIIARVLTDSIIALRPQATQLFARHEYKEFYKLIYSYTKILFSLAIILSMPIIMYAGDILYLWLGVVPEYAKAFVILLMVYSIIRSYHEPLDIIFKASARMKEYQLISAASMMMTFGLSWVTLSMGLGVYSVFIVLIIMEICLWYALACLAIKDGLNLSEYFLRGVLPALFYWILCAIIGGLIIVSGIYYLLGCMLYVAIALIIGFYIILSEKQRTLIVQKIISKIHVC